MFHTNVTWCAFLMDFEHYCISQQILEILRSKTCLNIMNDFLLCLTTIFVLWHTFSRDFVTPLYSTNWKALPVAWKFRAHLWYKRRASCGMFHIIFTPNSYNLSHTSIYTKNTLFASPNPTQTKFLVWTIENLISF